MILLGNWTLRIMKFISIWMLDWVDGTIQVFSNSYWVNNQPYVEVLLIDFCKKVGCLKSITVSSLWDSTWWFQWDIPRQSTWSSSIGDLSLWFFSRLSQFAAAYLPSAQARFHKDPVGSSWTAHPESRIYRANICNVNIAMLLATCLNSKTIFFGHGKLHGNC